MKAFWYVCELMIDILIPTYNRSEDLIRNLNHISNQLTEGRLEQEFKILISDNCSTDYTESMSKDFIAANSNISIEYYLQQSNIGLEKNAVSILSRSTSEWIIWLGDDDYFDEGYLTYCVEAVQKEKELGCIIPGLQELYKDGTVKPARLEKFEEKQFDSGFETIWEISHLAHQMSGILLRRGGLLEAYLRNEKYRNPYLFIFLAAHSMDSHRSIYAPKYKTKVSVENVKDWGYNKVGLLDEVYKSYYPFIGKYGEVRTADLLIRFTTMHSYRLAFKSKSLSRLIEQYRYLISITSGLKTFNRKLRFFFLKDFIKAILH